VAFIVLLDANAIYPATLRDVLLTAADRDLYQLRLSRRIVEEMRQAVVEKNPHANMDRTIAAIERAFGDTYVEGYERLESSMTNDAGDRHVLAAAVASGAGLIVTNNLKHFPDNACSPHGIEVQTPEDFLLSLLDLDEERMLGVLDEVASHMVDQPQTASDVLEPLRKHAPTFASAALRGLARRTLEAESEDRSD